MCGRHDRERNKEMKGNDGVLGFFCAHCLG